MHGSIPVFNLRLNGPDYQDQLRLAQCKDLAQVTDQLVLFDWLASKADIAVGANQVECVCACAIQFVQLAVRVQKHRTIPVEVRGFITCRDDKVRLDGAPKQRFNAAGNLQEVGVSLSRLHRAAEQQEAPFRSLKYLKQARFRS